MSASPPLLITFPQASSSCHDSGSNSNAGDPLEYHKAASLEEGAAGSLGGLTTGVTSGVTSLSGAAPMLSGISPSTFVPDDRVSSGRTSRLNIMTDPATDPSAAAAAGGSVHGGGSIGVGGGGSSTYGGGSVYIGGSVASGAGGGLTSATSLHLASLLGVNGSGGGRTASESSPPGSPCINIGTIRTGSPAGGGGDGCEQEQQ